MLVGRGQPVPGDNGLEIVGGEVPGRDLGVDVQDPVEQSGPVKLVVQIAEIDVGAVLLADQGLKDVQTGRLAVLARADQDEALVMPGLPGQAVAEELLELVDDRRDLDRLFQEAQPAGTVAGGSGGRRRCPADRWRSAPGRGAAIGRYSGRARRSGGRSGGREDSSAGPRRARSGRPPGRPRPRPGPGCPRCPA